MENELKGMWRLTFVKRFNGKTWETISRYHKGMTIKFHTQYPQINGERYQMQLIPGDYLILSNPSDTIRIEFARMPETWPVKKKRRRESTSTPNF